MTRDRLQLGLGLRFFTHNNTKGSPLPDLFFREEFHLSVFAPENSDEPEAGKDDPIGQVLDSPAFQTQLLQAIRHIFQLQPALTKVVVSLSR